MLETRRILAGLKNYILRTSSGRQLEDKIHK
jgi:hypothetical protein